MENPARSKIK